MNMDTRKINIFLNELKDKHPENMDLLESIQMNFNEEFKPLTHSERKALVMHPMQFVKRISEPDGSWTSQLHIWAEQGVPEIMDLDPMFLTFSNSHGDTVLHCLVTGLTGAYTEKVDYPALENILTKELSYEDIDTDNEGNQVKSVIVPLNVKDSIGKTPLDYIIAYAYGTDIYEGTNPDQQLIDILIKISENND